MPCILCKKPPKPICEKCLGNLNIQVREEKLFEVNGFSFCSYDSEFSVILNAIKENNLTSLVKPLVSRFSLDWPKPLENSCLVPVPSSFSNSRKRGFSHNKLFIQEFVKRVPGMQTSEILLSAKDRKDQTGLDAAQRASNMEQAFKVRAGFKQDRRYVLFDDISTTGATLSQAIAALREAGIEPAGYVVLARSGA